MNRTRRRIAIAVLIPLMLAGCAGERPREVEQAAEATLPDVPAGASVAEIRRIEAGHVRPDDGPRFEKVGASGRLGRLGRAVLIDLGTGCQYVARTIFQDGIDLSPLMESAPGEPGGARQRCGPSRPGSDEIVVLAGGDIASIDVSIERDRETGCEYVVATIFNDDLAVVPRTAAKGNERRPICRNGLQGA